MMTVTNYSNARKNLKALIDKVNEDSETVPNHIKPIAKEFEVFQGKDGVIVYVPKRENPFHDEAFIKSHDLTQSESFGGKLIGEEIPKN